MKHILRLLLLLVSTWAISSSKAQTIFGLTTDNRMFATDVNHPGTLINLTEVTDLPAGERLLAIDMQPGTGELFGLTYNATTGMAALYNIDVDGPGYIAVPVNGAIQLELGTAPSAGFDFNPVNNSEIFVTGSSGNVYILNALTGGILFTGGSIFYAEGDINDGNTPIINTIAHTSNFRGADYSVQLGYDVNNNVLVQFDPDVNATIHTVGLPDLSIDNGAPVAMDSYFDTSNYTDVVYMAIKSPADSRNMLVQFDPGTGQAVRIGSLSAQVKVRDIAFDVRVPVPPTVAGQIITALTRNRRNLIFFDSQNPSIIRDVKQITGVTPGQDIVAIDYRPFDLELYALGYNSRGSEYQVYRIDPTTGAASPVNLAPEVLNLGVGPDVLASFDFNPFSDRIHVIGSNGISYHLSPSTGLLLNTDNDFAYAPTDANTGAAIHIGAIAYTNSYFNANLSRRVGIDYTNRSFVNFTGIDFTTLNTQANLANVLDTGLYTNAALDIYYAEATRHNVGFLATNVNDYRQSYLYTIDPSTGYTSFSGIIGRGIPVIDIAAQLTYTGKTVEYSGDLALSPQGLYVYPNPVTNYTSVLLPTVALRRVSVTILDFNGDILMSRVFKPGGNQVNLDLSDIPQGMYSLRVQEQGTPPEMVKLVKQ
ncbi:DUF4394 domain-containing protein [Polluticoccus soli]|uniref:DUF4394 domain-containing protein n=1 Tax=Polluticoccus soli TaxID=3034150 RepID=UPI0023E29845|nr:DUF4394 domain-containing protein [Flavipsychrobacter sp. JY13-12]